MELYDYITEIIKTTIVKIEGNVIGRSIEGREIQGFVFGTGTKRVSLIAGNHADEPIGPLLLKKLVSYFSNLETNHFLLKTYTWYIVPHGNPDGEWRNKKWYSYEDNNTDLAKYLKNAIRELPGDDIEFGFPIAGSIKALRPENKAIYNFWKSAETFFDLHVSLHGMSATYGPWFLIDESWIERSEMLRSKCVKRTKALGYQLYDLDRGGEKGFKRIAEGFCTRPNSKEMRKHFISLGDEAMAQKFHASSMESIRSLGGDCLTLVTEMPLFIFPKEERTLKWPDPFLQKWSNQFATWKLQLKANTITSKHCNQEAKEKGVISMEWKDQMLLQWQFIVAGLEELH